MSNNSNFHTSWHKKLDGVVVALVFIAVGFLFILRNLGIIDHSFFRFIISWQMLLVVIGVVELIKQKYVGGGILIFIGGYFLFPKLFHFTGPWFATWWPLIFIFIGLLILLKRKDNKFREEFDKREKDNSIVCDSVDGYIISDVTFGSAQKIVFDPVFKGAKIKNTFGSTILDLRRTKLEDVETVIQVENSFGNIELYIPSTWNVFIEADTSFSGYSDKRFRSPNDIIDTEHKLVIRGELAFSGMEIKN